jgi:hypothetical protein
LEEAQETNPVRLPFSHFHVNTSAGSWQLFLLWFILVLSPSGETEELEGNAITNRLPYGDRLLTMDEVVSELGLPSTMPSDSRRRRYFFGKVWSPKAKFDVNFKVPQAVPLSKKAGEMTKTILSKWFGSRPIPRKRKRMVA